MDITKRSVVVGVFKDHGQAELAVEALRRAGFDNNHIGIVVREGYVKRVTAVSNEKHTHAEDGAVGGVIVQARRSEARPASRWLPV